MSGFREDRGGRPQGRIRIKVVCPMGVKKCLFTIFAVTAVMLAILGAGSASATVLCSESETECTSYGKGAAIDASLTGTTTFSTTSETDNETIEELIWGSCTNTTTTINKGELEIHWISSTSNGTVTGKSISVTLNTAFG